MGIFLWVVWSLITIVQQFLGFGTAYRLTKNGGDNGVALWGWMLLMSLVALIPGLGYCLWKKYKTDNTFAEPEDL